MDSVGLTDLVISGVSGNVNRVDMLSGSARNIILNSPTTAVTFVPASFDPQSTKLVMSDNQYYIQSLDNTGHPSYYRAMSAASHDTVLGRSSVINSAITTLELYPPQTQVMGINLSDADVTFSHNNGDIIPENNSRLLRGTAGYIMEVKDGAGNFTYYDAAVSVTNDHMGDHISVISSSMSPTRLFTDVEHVTGNSTIKIDPTNVTINYTDREGKQFTNVLSTDDKGQYIMNIADDGASSSKTVTIVRQSDNSLLVKTVNGNGELQIYHNMSYVASTDASTNQTIIAMYEADDEIRLRHPDKPLAALDEAISLVDSKRSYIGVMTNRLESISSVQSESIIAVAAARSRIMDADYAIEVSVMSKATIIQQAGTSMLAQANQQARAVLELLR